MYDFELSTVKGVVKRGQVPAMYYMEIDDVMTAVFLKLFVRTALYSLPGGITAR
jgi:hypothetical protein